MACRSVSRYLSFLSSDSDSPTDVMLWLKAYNALIMTRNERLETGVEILSATAREAELHARWLVEQDSDNEHWIRHVGAELAARDQYDEAEEDLLDAYELAMEHRHYEVALHSVQALAMVVGTLQKRAVEEWEAQGLG